MQIKNRQQFLTIVTLAAIGLLAIDRIISPPLVAFWNGRAARIRQLQAQVK